MKSAGETNIVAYKIQSNKEWNLVTQRVKIAFTYLTETKSQQMTPAHWAPQRLGMKKIVPHFRGNANG